MQGVFSIEKRAGNLIIQIHKEEKQNGNSKYCRKLKSLQSPKGYQTDFVNGTTTS